MRIRTLSIQFRRSFEVIEFGENLTFFHGKFSSGKSSIARLIDFCLGGDLQLTPALSSEFVAAHLDMELCGHAVLLERNRQQQGFVQVTWAKDGQYPVTMLAPTDASGEPLFDNVHSLSDLLFWLCDITPPKVRRNTHDPDAPMVRLSFRDLWVYCYLRQEDLDSSFFKLEVAFRQKKSRDAMLFVTGLQNEAISELEAKIADLSEQRRAKENTLHEVRAFLRAQGISDSIRLGELIKETEEQCAGVVLELEGMRQEQQYSHPVDELRAGLRSMSERLDKERGALGDLGVRLHQQQQLISEYRSMKMKLLREGGAERLLGKASFSCCPACGKAVEESRDETCVLCGSAAAEGPDELRSTSLEIPLRDLDQRIQELELSILRVQDALTQQELRVHSLESEKRKLDSQLAMESRAYDSVFLARVRGLEAQRARQEEHLQGLRQLLSMHQGLAKLVDRVQEIGMAQDSLRENLAVERERAAESEKYVLAIERAYHTALLEVGVPGVRANDTVKINRRTWIPYIHPSGDESMAWSFYNAGSGGKKTLMNVCYAIAVHAVAEENNLPLPGVLVIDTPMKNITEDVNSEIFEQFYRYLYSLLRGPMSGTQVVLIDNSLVDSGDQLAAVKERYMTSDEPEHPPLIPYYVGP